jgi:hypothetical protein
MDVGPRDDAGLGSHVVVAVVGLIAGIVVLIGAAMLYAKPEQRQTWGIVIIIASALNFFVGMGGLVAGALGVIGGALALSKG